jgi:hypothetical protein
VQKAGNQKGHIGTNVFNRGWLIVRVPRRLLLITKEEVHVLQAVIAEQCQLIVPYTAAEAALYEVENYIRS